MAKYEELQKIEEELAKELPGFVVCGVVETQSGLPLAGTSSDPNYDITVPAGAFAQALRSVDKAYDYSKWGKAKSVLLEGEDVIVILFKLKGGKYYQGIGVKSSTALGLVRAIFSKYVSKVEELLP